MQTLGIIGTAGRKDDKNRMTKELYSRMYGYALGVIEEYKFETLISGGAAWADHLAVRLFLDGHVPGLTLYLPSPFLNSKFQGEYRSPGSTANFYHEIMSRTLGYSTLRQITLAKDKGAQGFVIPGFKPRNKFVAAESEYLLAYTFGSHNGTYTEADPGYSNAATGGLKDGGTAHTWALAQSEIKEHVSLWTI